MAAGHPTELSAALLETLRDCNVHESLREALQQQELLTVEDFAYAFPTISHLDSLFSGLDEEVKTSLSITDAASSVHCARLRRALDKCHAKGTVVGQRSQPLPAVPAQAAQALSIAALQPDSWAEHLPPKHPGSGGDHAGHLCPQLSRSLAGSGHHAFNPPVERCSPQPQAWPAHSLDPLAASPQPKAVPRSHGGQSHQALEDRSPALVRSPL